MTDWRVIGCVELLFYYLPLRLQLQLQIRLLLLEIVEVVSSSNRRRSACQFSATTMI